jgi:hypothetical protein
MRQPIRTLNAGNIQAIKSEFDKSLEGLGQPFKENPVFAC